MAALFDGIRVDHLIGFYRTFGRPAHGAPFFNPGDEGAQIWQGESVLRIFQATGVELIAEDLGTVPDFLRASLARLGVPGCKVLRWERDWHSRGSALPGSTRVFRAVGGAHRHARHDDRGRLVGGGLS